MQRWQGNLKQLQTWSSAINYQQQTQALIESIEYMALRLAPVVHGRQHPVADLKPPPDLPVTRSLVRDIEFRGNDLRQSAAGYEDVRAATLRFMSATAQLHSLAEAIHDCRDKANALDWEAWNRSRL